MVAFNVRELHYDSPLRTRSRQVLASLATAMLAMTGVVMTSTAAHAVSVSYVSSSTGAVSTVDATQITTATSGNLDGWYVCNSTVSLLRLAVATGDTLNLILGDSCNLTIDNFNNTSAPGSGIDVQHGAALNIYSQTINSGHLYTRGYTDGWPGIGYKGAIPGAINIYGGMVEGHGGSYASGIGGGTNTAGGIVNILWRASVYVRSGVAPAGNGVAYAAAAIGSGGAAWGDAHLDAGTISIDTTGRVQSTRQDFTGSPAYVGQGGGVTGIGVTLVPRIDMLTPVITPSGSAAVTNKLVNSVSFTTTLPAGISVGSALTFRVVPVSPRDVVNVQGNGVEMEAIGGTAATGFLFLHKITSTTTPQPIEVTTRIGTALAIVASPSVSQTRPGDVVLTTTLSLTATSAGLAAQLVSFYQDSVLLGTATTNNAGVATYTLVSPAAGTHAYQTKWVGDDDYVSADSNLLSGYQVLRDTQEPLTLTGLTTPYIYGDGPFALTTTGGSGTGDIALTSSDPAVASLSSVTTAGAGTLTLNRAGTFTVTQTKAQDSTFNEESAESPVVTVTEATPYALLTRTGGEYLESPLADLTLLLQPRGSGSAPQGLVQFYLNGEELGGPLPLVENGGVATVTLNGVPITTIGKQQVTAKFLGDAGRYVSVTKTVGWIFESLCLVLPYS